MSSTLFVDAIEPNLSSGVHIPGHVIQVVQGDLNSILTSSTTPTSLGALSITLSSSSSKVLITFTNHIYGEPYSGGAWRGALVTLKRGSTVINDEAGKFGESNLYNDGAGRRMTYSTKVLLDSPSTVGSVTYEIFGSTLVATSIQQFNNSSYGSGGRVILQEIAQ